VEAYRDFATLRYVAKKHQKLQLDTKRHQRHQITVNNLQ
jgi:hypothetical protein